MHFASSMTQNNREMIAEVTFSSDVVVPASLDLDQTLLEGV